MRMRAVVLVALFSFGLWPSEAAAQPSRGVIRLVDQPLWHQPGRQLDLELRVSNPSDLPLEGFIVSVEGHQRVSSRSALHEALLGDAGFSASSFSDFSYRDQVLAPGDARVIELDDPVDELLSLAQATSGGVYPVTVSLFDAQGVELDTLTTPLIYYPTPPDIPLGVVLAIPLNEMPSRGADGVFDPTGAGEWLLEEAITSSGWLTGLIDVMREALVPHEIQPPPRDRGKDRRRRDKREREREPEVIEALNISLAPTPRFIEELADMANGYQRAAEDGSRSVNRTDARARSAAQTLSAIRELLRLPSVQPSLVPYSFPDLPTIEAALDLEQGISPQLREARNVLSETLDTEISARWLFPPAGRLDSATIAGLKAGSESFAHAFFSEESFEAPVDTPLPGCPSPSPSFTCSVTARTSEGPVTGLITDAGIQDRFARLAQEGDDRLDLQGLFAETAMIREEIPGVAGRVVQATIPSLWHPDASMYESLLKGFRDAPWLETLTPDQAFAESTSTGRRTLLPSLDPLRTEPPEDLFTNIAEAQQLVDSFELVRPPAALTEQFRRNLLLAQSRLWSQSVTLDSRAESYVTETANATRTELTKIRIGGGDEIRLTSQRGQIPIEIFNDADYPVSVNIHILSTDLRIDRVIPQDLQPGRFQQLTVDILARSSGIYPLEVTVETPDGSYVIDRRSITVRSTEFNQVALFITLGALGFLVFFFILRGIRRRRQPAEDEG
ncbi:MAG TPA: DUF6049 family protein [Actinomycetota bacterium]|nr:DUF6049 family protein [Actinomycetota bacterium]